MYKDAYSCLHIFWKFEMCQMFSTGWVTSNPEVLCMLSLYHISHPITDSSLPQELPFLLIKGFTIFLFPFLFHSLLPYIPVLAQFPTPFSCLWPGAGLQWRVRVFLVFVLQPFSPDWSRVGAGLAASSAALSSYHRLLPEFFHCFLPLCPLSTSVTKCLFWFSPKQRLTLVYSFQ